MKSYYPDSLPPGCLQMLSWKVRAASEVQKRVRMTRVQLLSLPGTGCMTGGAWFLSLFESQCPPRVRNTIHLSPGCCNSTSSCTYLWSRIYPTGYCYLSTCLPFTFCCEGPGSHWSHLDVMVIFNVDPFLLSFSQSPSHLHTPRPTF